MLADFWFWTTSNEICCLKKKNGTSSWGVKQISCWGNFLWGNNFLKNLWQLVTVKLWRTAPIPPMVVSSWLLFPDTTTQHVVFSKCYFWTLIIRVYPFSTSKQERGGGRQSWFIDLRGTTNFFFNSGLNNTAFLQEIEFLFIAFVYCPSVGKPGKSLLLAHWRPKYTGPLLSVCSCDKVSLASTTHIASMTLGSRNYTPLWLRCVTTVCDDTQHDTPQLERVELLTKESFLWTFVSLFYSTVVSRHFGKMSQSKWLRELGGVSWRCPYSSWNRHSCWEERSCSILSKR